MKRSTTVHALLERELTGMNSRPVFPRIPDRFRVDLPALGCRSMVLLGFSSNGSRLIGYSTASNESDQNEERTDTLIEVWEVDFARCRASNQEFTIRLPTLNAQQEVLVPLQIVHSCEKVMLITRYEDKPDGLRDVENSICITDESDRRFGTVGSVRYSLSQDANLVLLPTSFHIRCESTMISVAFDMGQHIRVVFMDVRPLPVTPSVGWWKRRDKDFDKHPEGVTFESQKKDPRLSQKGFVSCRTLDAEGFLVETLQNQLHAKLVLLSRLSETMDEGCFALLDYAIRFVRFTTATSFEFVVVSRVEMRTGKSFVAIVAQTSLTGHRIIHVLKSLSTEGSLEGRCSRLVQTRLKGFQQATQTVKLDNAPVIAGKALARIVNPFLPFEVVLRADEGPSQ